MGAPSKKDQLIEAALKIIIDEGAAKLSFDTLSERTGFTKSGILYHFPHKEALFEALATRVYEPFVELYKVYVTAVDAHPGRTVLGYIKALTEGCGNGVDACAAVTAIVSEQPQLLKIQRSIYETVREDVIADGGPFAEQWAIIATLDGLWFDDMAHIYNITESERQAIVDHCLEQAHTIIAQGETMH